MTEHPTFSIVVPTYNRPAQIEICLSALAAMDYPRDRYEAVIVDDGGKTDLKSVAERFASTFDVRLIRQENAGPSAARNTGAKIARHDYLAFTDDDCSPRPQWLLELAKTLKRHPDAMIGGPCVNALPSNPFASASQMLLEVAHMHFNRDIENALFFPSDNIAMSRHRFEGLGGFDNTFRWAEDRDLCDRWRARGWRLVYAGDALIDHAHRMGFKGYWKQHFGYGRGALNYHKERARRQTGKFEVDGSFYRKLMTHPLQTEPMPRGLMLASLLATSQAAVASGMLFETLARSRQRKMSQSNPAIRPTSR